MVDLTKMLSGHKNYPGCMYIPLLVVLREYTLATAKPICHAGRAQDCQTEFLRNMSSVFEYKKEYCSQLLGYIRVFRACYRQYLGGCPDVLLAPYRREYEGDISSYKQQLSHCVQGTDEPLAAILSSSFTTSVYVDTSTSLAPPSRSRDLYIIIPCLVAIIVAAFGVTVVITYIVKRKDTRMNTNPSSVPEHDTGTETGSPSTA